MSNFMSKCKESFDEVKHSTSLKVGLVSTGLVTGSVVSSFADGPAATNPAVITADMIKPIVTIVTSNIATILPVGITIMGAIIGVALIPRIIYKFL